MSRAFLKNDLFNLAFQQQEQKKQVERRKKQESNKEILKKKCQTQKKLQTQSKSNKKLDYQRQVLDVDKAMKVEVKGTNHDYNEQLKNIFSQFGTAKKQGNQNQSQQKQKKKLFFTPRAMKTVPQIKTQPPKPQTIKQADKEEKKLRIQMWKFNKQIKKAIENPRDENLQQDKLKQGQDNKKTTTKQSQSQQQQQQQQPENDKGKKSVRKAKTTQPKKKKIRKQQNYVRLNLKGKYKDRFVGGVNRNIRALKKKAKLKRLGIATQLQVAQGQIYNSFINSLSKALFVSIPLEQSDQQCQASSSGKLKYTIPQDYSKENLQKLIRDIFGFQKFREGQFQTIQNVLNGQSTLFVSETASGKSLTYILPSIIMKGFSIVVSPLVSLMLDQLQHLPNDLPAACISSLLTYQQRQRIILMAKNNKIQLLFVTPQTFLTDFMFHLKQFPPVNFVCIDEAHSMSQLSHSFRPSYLSLQQILLKYFKFKNEKPVILCLTATANIETMQSICQKLKIKNSIRSTSTINKNLFITVSRQEFQGKYQALIKYLHEQNIRKLKGILIYCRTKKIMYEVFNYLINSGMGCAVYHSGLTQKQKVDTMEKFRKSLIRIVIATVSLGMGLDFANLNCVIHINMPKSVQNYIQETGRAGRRQTRAYCHLFLDKNDYYVERNYFLADELELEVFKRIVVELKKKTFLKNQIKGEKKTKKNKDDPKIQNQLNSLKRLKISDNQDQNKDIFFEDESQEHLQNEEFELKIDQLIKKQQKKESVQEQLQKQFRQLYSCKSEYLTQIAGLKQEAMLNILLKIQKQLGKVCFKMMPIAHETVKIGFFKNNQKQIQKESQLFCELIRQVKNAKGLYYIPLVQKCNTLKMSPIQLLTQMHALAKKYSLKIQQINQIFIWSCESAELFRKLQNATIQKSIINQFNRVQKTSLIKLNIFYSICFNNSKKSLPTMISNKEIINITQDLPQQNIIKQFDQYFKEETYGYYRQIIDSGKNDNELSLDREQASYLPINEIIEQDQVEIKQNVQLFLKNILMSNQQMSFTELIKPYRNGRIITRVFMGVNDTTSNWKTYGQHSYWMKFKDRDYSALLKIVKNYILQYIVTEGPKYLEERKKLN